MLVDLEKIKQVSREIGLGDYGRLSSIRYQIALAQLEEYCNDGNRICEIGPGGVIAYIANYSDSEASAIVSPRENHWNDIFVELGIELFRWDLNEPLDDSLPKNCFDSLIFLETLEHLNRWPEEVIQDVCALLRPGGCFDLEHTQSG